MEQIDLVARTIFFDSQDPILPQLEKLGVELKDHESQDTADLPQASMKAIVDAVREVFGLTLFGFDTIVDAETGSPALIDINYFPGYLGFDNFASILLQHLISVSQSKQK